MLVPKQKSSSKDMLKETSSGGSTSQALAESPLMMKKEKDSTDRISMPDVVDEAVSADYAQKVKDKPKTKQWASLRNDLSLMKAGKKTASKVGATLAKRMGSARADDLWKEIEGLKKEGGHDAEIAKLQVELDKANELGDKYTKLIGGPETFMKDEIDNHLAEFRKGGIHAFIVADYHAGFQGAWGGWGKDNGNNFVAPLPAANAIVDKAINGEGIRTLEVALGIPAWDWVKKCPDGIIYRYIIPADKVEQVGLKMAEGFEESAYNKEWIAGGRTEGRAKEAVIKTFRGKDYVNAIASKVLVIEALDLSKQTPSKEIKTEKES